MSETTTAAERTTPTAAELKPTAARYTVRYPVRVLGADFHELRGPGILRRSTDPLFIEEMRGFADTAFNEGARSTRPEVDELKMSLVAMDAKLARYERALQHIAILDDNDCYLANDPKQMTELARAALKSGEQS